jgi:hypothetical protein
MANLTGIKYVELNGMKYEIQGEVFTEADLRTVAEEIDPSVANATMVAAGDTVTFQRQAGTKGTEVTKVSYNGLEFVPQTSNPDPKDVQTAMIEAYPELANAEYSIDVNGVMTFRLRAGTKGM